MSWKLSGDCSDVQSMADAASAADGAGLSAATLLACVRRPAVASDCGSLAPEGTSERSGAGFLRAGVRFRRSSGSSGRRGRTPRPEVFATVLDTTNATTFVLASGWPVRQVAEGTVISNKCGPAGGSLAGRLGLPPEPGLVGHESGSSVTGREHEPGRCCIDSDCAPRVAGPA